MIERLLSFFLTCTQVLLGPPHSGHWRSSCCLGHCHSWLREDSDGRITTQLLKLFNSFLLSCCFICLSSMFGSVIVRQDVRMCEEDLMPLYRYKLSSLCSWTKQISKEIVCLQSVFQECNVILSQWGWGLFTFIYGWHFYAFDSRNHFLTVEPFVFHEKG